MSSSIGVLGTGAYLPSRVVTNDEIAGPAGVDEEWVLRKTGIRTRRRARPDEATSDLATNAARAALADAGLKPADLSMLIVATTTPDAIGQPTACLVAGNLDCPIGTAAFDLNATCSGFLYGITVAERALRADGGYALIVGADMYHRFVNTADPRTAALWGDAAGAVVLGPVEPGRGLRHSQLLSYGAEPYIGHAPSSGTRIPPSAEAVARGQHLITMDGRRMTALVAERVPLLLKDFLAETGVSLDEIDHVIPHQGNERMVQVLKPLLGLGDIPVHSRAAEYGSTGSATIPVTMDAVARQGGFKPGESILMISFGAGITFAFALMRWR